MNTRYMLMVGTTLGIFFAFASKDALTPAAHAEMAKTDSSPSVSMKFGTNHNMLAEKHGDQNQDAHTSVVIKNSQTSDASSSASPYTEESQSEKEHKILKDYNESRDTLGEGIGMAMATVDPYADTGLDGDDLESQTAPNRDDALIPLTKNGREIQEALEQDLVAAGIVDAYVRKEIQALMSDPGGPDNVEEFTERLKEKAGHKVTLSPEALARIQQQWVTYHGHAGFP